MKQRIQQLDFLKAVCIVLMVIFHLVFIGDKYPYAKQIVYTFHMPVFLLISGYLTHWQRPAKDFWKSQFWLFIPYIILELPYVVLSGRMGVRGGDTDLSASHLLYRILVEPLGPYWFLHTLIICNISGWLVNRFMGRYGKVAWLVALAGILGVWVYAAGLVSNIVWYYFAGVVVAQCGLPFLRVFYPTWLALLPAVVLCCFPVNLHSSAVGGWAITYLVVSFLCWVYRRIRPSGLQIPLYLGRNTLSIFLFSPIFTMAVKPLVKVFSFDSTGCLFMLTATAVAIAGSLAIAWMMDRMKLSPWFCGRTHLLCK